MSSYPDAWGTDCYFLSFISGKHYKQSVSVTEYIHVRLHPCVIPRVKGCAHCGFSKFPKLALSNINAATNLASKGHLFYLFLPNWTALPRIDTRAHGDFSKNKTLQLCSACRCGCHRAAHVRRERGRKYDPWLFDSIVKPSLLMNWTGTTLLQPRQPHTHTKEKKE